MTGAVSPFCFGAWLCRFYWRIHIEMNSRSCRHMSARNGNRQTKVSWKSSPLSQITVRHDDNVTQTKAFDAFDRIWPHTKFHLMSSLWCDTRISSDQSRLTDNLHLKSTTWWSILDSKSNGNGFDVGDKKRESQINGFDAESRDAVQTNAIICSDWEDGQENICHFIGWCPNFKFSVKPSDAISLDRLWHEITLCGMWCAVRHVWKQLNRFVNSVKVDDSKLRHTTHIRIRIRCQTRIGLAEWQRWNPNSKRNKFISIFFDLLRHEIQLRRQKSDRFSEKTKRNFV